MFTGPFSVRWGSQQFAGGPPQVVLVDDRFGMAVREIVLVPEPADLLLEAESGAFVDGAKPVGDFTTGAVGDAGEQVAMGLLGEDLGHRRLRTHSMKPVLQVTVPERSPVGNSPA